MTRRSLIALSSVTLVAAVIVVALLRHTTSLGTSAQSFPPAESGELAKKKEPVQRSNPPLVKHEPLLAHSVETLQSTIMNSATPAQAIMEARTKFGQTDSVTYAETYLRAICSDSMGSVPTDPTDVSRAWAIKRLHTQCEGVGSLPETNIPILFYSPAEVAKDTGVEAGIAAAVKVIASSDEAAELSVAGQVLAENGQLNSSQIAGLDSNLGTQDVVQDWIYASTLWSCDQNGGCGPDNFKTVAFCANAGCAAGSTLWSGMRAALPAREMQAVEVLYQWIENNRS